MPVATLADAQIFERDGFTFRPLAVPSRGSQELALWALDVAPGAASAAHTVDREELFVVHAGALSATVGGADHQLAVGDVLMVPPHTLVSVRNPLGEPARATVVTSAGMRGTVDGVTFAPPWAQ
jgi:mannose-6-phosphate isomerase-like protein (cupin superfamily)